MDTSVPAGVGKFLSGIITALKEPGVIEYFRSETAVLQQQLLWALERYPDDAYLEKRREGHLLFIEHMDTALDTVENLYAYLQHAGNPRSKLSKDTRLDDVNRQYKLVSMYLPSLWHSVMMSGSFPRLYAQQVLHGKDGFVYSDSYTENCYVIASEPSLVLLLLDEREIEMAVDYALAFLIVSPILRHEIKILDLALVHTVRRLQEGYRPELLRMMQALRTRYFEAEHTPFGSTVEAKNMSQLLGKVFLQYQGQVEEAVKLSILRQKPQAGYGVAGWVDGFRSVFKFTPGQT